MKITSLIVLSLFLMLVFAGCHNLNDNSYIKYTYNISIGSVDSIIDYNPSTFSNIESCILLVNNKTRVIKDTICSNIMEDDEIFKHPTFDDYVYKRDENYFN